MSLSETMRAMAAAGAGVDVLIAFVEVMETSREAADNLRRLKDAERQRRRRQGYPDDWQALRRQVFERDNWTCVYCGCDIAGEPHCDHILPVAKGGDTVIANLATACERCNCSKGAKTLAEWVRP